ncbi:MAG: Glu-tRNA(Gln) amidotransferase subunit GatD [Candidatus Nanosalina sp.]
MYSQEILDELDEKGIETGDIIEASGRKGKLMPKPESGDPDTLILKDESGYNIGVDPEDIVLVEKKESLGREKAEIEHDDEKPDILILHTGGTIASRVSYEEGGVKPAFDPEELVEMYPELAEEVNIHSEVVAQMASEDMEPQHWRQIAEKIDENQEDYEGIVVGHGTDTLSYTGAALTLMLKGLNIGVMLVGSQRSSDRPSTDAAMNLYCAGKFLSETEFNGVGVCMHKNSSDKICQVIPAAKSRKNHTSRRDAFEPVNSGVYAEVNYETGEIQEGKEEWPGNQKYEFKAGLNEDVGYLKTRPGMDPEEIDFLLDQDYDGVILEGTGLGHIPVSSFDEHTEHHEEMLEKVSELSEDSLVIITSQCINGRIDQNVYDNLLKLKNAGVVGAEDMHPELAYVKLMWSLGQTDDLDEAEEIFLENQNSELKDRSKYRD